MKQIMSIGLLTMVLLTLLTLPGCDNRHNSIAFEVVCDITPDSLAGDSVRLFVVDDNYQHLMRLGCLAPRKGHCVFTGQTLGTHVAMVTIDSTATPYYFVLQPGKTQLKIDTLGCVIAGGKLNEQYMSFVKLHRQLTQQRTQLHEQYVLLADSGVLTLKQEKDMAVRDSLLADSLQHITVRFINRGDAPARIVRELFFNTLRADSRKAVEH